MQILEGQLKLRYSGGAGLEAGYCRVSSVTLSVEMLPSVQITNWDVLPAETWVILPQLIILKYRKYCRQWNWNNMISLFPYFSNSQFYLVLDIANITSHELELQYTSSKCISIEGHESCRIPVPINRCPLSKLTKVSWLAWSKLFLNIDTKVTLLCGSEVNTRNLQEKIHIAWNMFWETSRFHTLKITELWISAMVSYVAI